MPADLAAALDASPRAARAFEALGRTQRYAFILDIVTARSARTRQARVARAIAALQRPSAARRA